MAAQAISPLSRIRRLFALAFPAVAAALLLAGAGSASSPQPMVLASWTRGYHLMSVGQGAGALAWCTIDRAYRQTLTLRRPGRPAQSVSGNCGAADFALLPLPRGVVFGGWAEVRCADTHAEIWAAARDGLRPHRLSVIGSSCLGHGDFLSGLASDGHDGYYTVLTVGGKDDCEYNGPQPGVACTYTIAGSRAFRVRSGVRERVPWLPPAAALAGAAGRLAIAEPEPGRGNYDGRNELDFPRAATNGNLRVYRSADGKLLASVRLQGVARTLALSGRYLSAFVERDGVLRLDCYTIPGGRPCGSHALPKTVDRWHLSAAGRRVAYRSGRRFEVVEVVDLVSGRRPLVYRTRGSLTVPALTATRMLVGEVGTGRTRVLSFQLPPER